MAVYPKRAGRTCWCLEAILLDSGFRNVTCELKPNAFCNCSYRRLMGRSEANPTKPDSGEQKDEHWVGTQEFNYKRINHPSRRLLSQLPPGLKQEARPIRRTVGQMKRAYARLFWWPSK